MISFHDYGFGHLTFKRPIPPCRWDCFDLLCVHKGQLRLTFERRQKVDLSAKMCALIYPLTPFEGKPTTESCRISVQHFDIESDTPLQHLPSPFKPLVGKKHGYEIHQLQHGSMASRDIERAIRFAFDHPNKPLYDLRVAQLTLILGQLEPIQNRHATQATGEQWQTLIDWLRRQLHDPPPVERMAEHCGLCASHFRVRFRQIFGQSPGRYLQQLRFQESQRLLRESNIAIKTIAQQTGYHDLPNFYRAFRQNIGGTPAAYRKQYVLKG